jgi:hypothetical protein
VTRLQERPEVLAAEVGREGFALSGLPVAAILCRNSGANREELGCASSSIRAMANSRAAYIAWVSDCTSWLELHDLVVRPMW